MLLLELVLSSGPSLILLLLLQLRVMHMQLLLLLHLQGSGCSCFRCTCRLCRDTCLLLCCLPALSVQRVCCKACRWWCRCCPLLAACSHGALLLMVLLLSLPRLLPLLCQCSLDALTQLAQQPLLPLPLQFVLLLLLLLLLCAVRLPCQLGVRLYCCHCC